MMANTWRSLPCKISELRLDITLDCGQSFRWKEIQPGVWRSVLADRVWTLRQTDREILYQVHEDATPVTPAAALPEKRAGSNEEQRTVAPSPHGRRKSGRNVRTAKRVDGDVSDLRKGDVGDECIHSALLQDYFRLGVSLGALYAQWASSDAHFARASARFPGVRLLRQDPTENLFAFICSSNNHIGRIAGMVERLCSTYGRRVAVVDGREWHAFPPVAALAREGVEKELREAGFGYRARFIHQTAKIIREKPDGWLEGLRKLDYWEAHAELTKLPGVGAKVADCVCLMSMDKLSAIPVDTHVWQIARRDYLPALVQTKSLTDRVYKEIGEFFRSLFGEYAGWAHSVLFSADLKKFQTKTGNPKSPAKRRNPKTDAGDAKRPKNRVETK